MRYATFALAVVGLFSLAPDPCEAADVVGVRGRAVVGVRAPVAVGAVNRAAFITNRALGVYGAGFGVRNPLAFNAFAGNQFIRSPINRNFVRARYFAPRVVVGAASLVAGVPLASAYAAPYVAQQFLPQQQFIQQQQVIPQQQFATGSCPCVGAAAAVPQYQVPAYVPAYAPAFAPAYGFAPAFRGIGGHCGAVGAFPFRSFGYGRRF